MREKFRKFNDILSWIMLIATSLLLVFTLITVKNTPKGEGAFLFGYRPVFVLTGSMEPYMMTNSICLTEKVDSMDDIAVGDVVTFHVKSESGKVLNITHRIVGIEDGLINTKGDNNSVTDNLPLTIENIDAKVIGVFNQSAWLIDKWETTTGKVMIISFALAIICAYFVLKQLIKDLFNRLFGTDKEENDSTDMESVVDESAESTIADEKVSAKRERRSLFYKPKYGQKRKI